MDEISICPEVSFLFTLINFYKIDEALKLFYSLPPSNVNYQVKKKFQKVSEEVS